MRYLLIHLQLCYYTVVGAQKYTSVNIFRSHFPWFTFIPKDIFLSEILHLIAETKVCFDLQTPNTSLLLIIHHVLKAPIYHS